MSCIITQFLVLERLYDKTPYHMWYNYPNCTVTFASKLHSGVFLISTQCGEYSYQVSNSNDFENVLDYQVCRYSISPYTWSRWMIPNQRLNYALSNLIGIEETLRSIRCNDGSISISLSGNFLDLKIGTTGFLLSSESNLINPVTTNTIKNLESSSDFTLSTNNDSLVLSTSELIKRHNNIGEMSNLAYNRSLKTLAVKTPLLLEDSFNSITINADNLVHNSNRLSNLTNESNEILGFNVSEEFIIETIGNDLYLSENSVFARINDSNLCFGNNLKNLVVNSNSNIELISNDDNIELSGNFVVNNNSNLTDNNNLKTLTVNSNDFNLSSGATELTISANKLLKKSVSNLVNQNDNTVKNLNVEYPLISNILNTNYSISCPDCLIKSDSNLLINNTVKNLTVSNGITLTTSNNEINLSTTGLVFQSNSNIAVGNNLVKLLPLWPLQTQYFWETNEMKISAPLVLTNYDVLFGFVSNLVSRDSNNELLQVLRDLRVSSDFTITTNNSANSITISTPLLVRRTRNNGSISNLTDGQYLKSLNVQYPLTNAIYGLSHNISGPTILTNDAPTTSSIVSNLISKYQGLVKTTLRNLTVSGSLSLSTNDDTINLTLSDSSNLISTSGYIKNIVINDNYDPSVISYSDRIEFNSYCEMYQYISNDTFTSHANRIYVCNQENIRKYYINNSLTSYIYRIEFYTFSIYSLVEFNFESLRRICNNTTLTIKKSINKCTISYNTSNNNKIIIIKVINTVYYQDVYIESCVSYIE